MASADRVCEFCGGSHGGEIGSGRFCSRSCAARFSRRKRENQRQDGIDSSPAAPEPSTPSPQETQSSKKERARSKQKARPSCIIVTESESSTDEFARATGVGAWRRGGDPSGSRGLSASAKSRRSRATLRILRDYGKGKRKRSAKSVFTPTDFRVKRRRRRTGQPADDSRNPTDSSFWDGVRRRLRYHVSKIRFARSFVDAYEPRTGGWQNKADSKIRPESELFRAKHQISKAKAKIRSLMRELLCKNSHLARIPAAKFAEDGIDFMDILCCACDGKTHAESETNDTLLCDGDCRRAFHQACCDPPVTAGQMPEEDEQWLCHQCACKRDCLDFIVEEFDDVPKEIAEAPDDGLSAALASLWPHIDAEGFSVVAPRAAAHKALPIILAEARKYVPADATNGLRNDDDDVGYEPPSSSEPSSTDLSSSDSCSSSEDHESVVSSQALGDKSESRRGTSASDSSSTRAPIRQRRRARRRKNFSEEVSENAPRGVYDQWWKGLVEAGGSDASYEDDSSSSSTPSEEYDWETCSSSSGDEDSQGDEESCDDDDSDSSTSSRRKRKRRRKARAKRPQRAAAAAASLTAVGGSAVGGTSSDESEDSDFEPQSGSSSDDASGSSETRGGQSETEEESEISENSNNDVSNHASKLKPKAVHTATTGVNVPSPRPARKKPTQMSTQMPLHIVKGEILPPRDQRVAVVRNLPEYLDDSEIVEVFALLGYPGVHVVSGTPKDEPSPNLNPKAKSSQRVIRVRFPSAEQATRCAAECDEADVDGKIIRIRVPTAQTQTTGPVALGSWRTRASETQKSPNPSSKSHRQNLAGKKTTSKREFFRWNSAQKAIVEAFCRRDVFTASRPNYGEMRSRLTKVCGRDIPIDKIRYKYAYTKRRFAAKQRSESSDVKSGGALAGQAQASTNNVPTSVRG